MKKALEIEEMEGRGWCYRYLHRDIDSHNDIDMGVFILFYGI